VKPYDHSTVVMTCPGCGAEVDVDIRLTLADKPDPGTELLYVSTTVVHNHGAGMEHIHLWVAKEE
jgi:hypothetical protein